MSWNGSNHGRSTDHLGRNVRNRAMKIPSPRPPRSARGRLTSRPIAAAAMATTTRWKKSGAIRVLNRGAISTPAMPAKKLDSIQATEDTRSASIPANSVIRGLSTTARMARPREVNRNRAPRPSMPTTATPSATSSSRLNG